MQVVLATQKFSIFEDLCLLNNKKYSHSGQMDVWTIFKMEPSINFTAD